ncbi:hypothetical protein [Caldanaerobacter subterraneus]|uniref:hypothetical protein n=1 Tax=Caldanaerobacter subterraneus TaxID=911092 RepID=UPI003898DD39
MWAYVIDALLAFVIVLCFAEASGIFEKTGGAYVYAKEAFGEFIGFEVGIVMWAVRINRMGYIISSFCYYIKCVLAFSCYWYFKKCDCCFFDYYSEFYKLFWN